MHILKQKNAQTLTNNKNLTTRKNVKDRKLLSNIFKKYNITCKLTQFLM